MLQRQDSKSGVDRLILVVKSSCRSYVVHWTVHAQKETPRCFKRVNGGKHHSCVRSCMLTCCGCDRPQANAPQMSLRVEPVHRSDGDVKENKFMSLGHRMSEHQELPHSISIAKENDELHSPSPRRASPATSAGALSCVNVEITPIGCEVEHAALVKL